MEKHAGDNFPWVVFSLNNSLFGISAGKVQSMVIIPKVFTVPEMPTFVRGVINIRNRVIPLIDLRIRLGMPSFLQEVDDFCSMMAQREKDHRNWLTELELSVKERREFKLATDPHQCAFGKWYDNFKPNSHSLATLLRKFDEPHRKIHSIALQVKNLEEQGNIEAAHKTINSCRDLELAQMINLFSQLRDKYQELQHETAIIINNDKGVFAVTVDSVESIEHFSDECISALDETQLNIADEGVILWTGRTKKNNELVMMLDDLKITKTLSLQNRHAYFS